MDDDLRKCVDDLDFVIEDFEPSGVKAKVEGVRMPGVGGAWRRRTARG